MLAHLAAEANLYAFRQKQDDEHFNEGRNFHKILRAGFSAAPPIDNPSMRSAHLSWFSKDPGRQPEDRLHRPAGSRDTHDALSSSYDGWASAVHSGPFVFPHPPSSIRGQVGLSSKPNELSHFLFDEACEQRLASPSTSSAASHEHERHMSWVWRTTLPMEDAIPTRVVGTEMFGHKGDKRTCPRGLDEEDDGLVLDGYRSALLCDENPARCDGDPSLRDEVRAVLGVHAYQGVGVMESSPSPHREDSADRAFATEGELFRHLHSGRRDTPKQHHAELFPWMLGPDRTMTVSSVHEFPRQAQTVEECGGMQLRSRLMEDLEPLLYPSATDAIANATQCPPLPAAQESKNDTTEPRGASQHGQKAKLVEFSPFMRRSNKRFFTT